MTKSQENLWEDRQRMTPDEISDIPLDQIISKDTYYHISGNLTPQQHKHEADEALRFTFSKKIDKLFHDIQSRLFHA